MSFAKSLLLGLGLVAVGCSTEATAPTTTRPPTTTGTPPDSNPGTGTDVPTTPAPPAGQIVTSGTWADGKQITDNVTIAAGETVEIAEGAQITVTGNQAITVKGTLHIKATKHAKISGTSWIGIVVASGGTLDVDGLDLSGAASAIWTQTGNTNGAVANAVIDAQVPFKMEPGSKLSIAHSKVTASSPSSIAGTFVASYLDYDKTTSEGLELSDAQGTMKISDSTLRGGGGGDYVVSRSGKLVDVSYTTIVGAHCGFHFAAVDKYTIDHVSDDTNTYGTMLYGSGAGPNTITYSNFRNTSYDLEMQNTNGPTTVDHNFTGGMGGKNVLQSGVKPTNVQTAPIADARPR